MTEANFTATKLNLSGPKSKFWTLVLSMPYLRHTHPSSPEKGPTNLHVCDVGYKQQCLLTCSHAWRVACLDTQYGCCHGVKSRAIWPWNNAMPVIQVNKKKSVKHTKSGRMTGRHTIKHHNQHSLSLSLSLSLSHTHTRTGIACVACHACHSPGTFFSL